MPSATPTFKIAEVVADLTRDGMPVRFTAYDGSAAGPEDAEIGLELTSQRGLQYLVTAPGDLGLARAYVAGDLVVHGGHPGNPYEVMQKLKDHTKFRRAHGGRAGHHRARPRPGEPQAPAAAARRSTCRAGAG